MSYINLKKIRKNIIYFIILGILVVISQTNYLFFHFLIEEISVLIALYFFMIIWISRDIIKNRYLVVIGLGYFFIAFLTVLHMISYKGLHVFNNYDYATQLWLGTRFLESLLLLSAIFIYKYGKKIRFNLLLSIYSISTILLIVSIFLCKIFPACHVENTGLTAFKINSEYVICFIFFIHMLLLLLNKKKFDTKIFIYLILAALFNILTELFFTLYIGVYDIFNLIGHILKWIAYFMLYKAIIKSNINNPFLLVFSEMQSTKQTLKDITESKEQSLNDINKILKLVQEEKKHLIKKTNYLIEYDIITGIFNREKILEILAENISIANFGCVILVDIDGLKYINNTYGNKQGDELLKMSVKVIQNSLDEMYIDKTTYFVGRLGGDEFVILLKNKPLSSAVKISNKIRSNIEKYHFFNDSIIVTLSVGISEYPAHGSTNKELIKKAEMALVRAKELGKNKVYFYDEMDKQLGDIDYNFEKKSWLQKAIKDESFILFYQPIQDIATGIISHYEVLVRLKDDDGNIILPYAFIPFAETFDLIESVDLIIIKKALQQLAELKKLHKNAGFSINISGKHIGSLTLLKFIRTTIYKLNIDPNLVTFEITETEAIKDIDKARNFIIDLKKIGCKFSLDDFGVGFTSFNYLKEMDIDYLKIDGSFIKNVVINNYDQEIVNAIQHIAFALNIKTIAEFVEDDKILQYLKSINVDYAQGYFIGKPSPNVFD